MPEGAMPTGCPCCASIAGDLDAALRHARELHLDLAASERRSAARRDLVAALIGLVGERYSDLALLKHIDMTSTGDDDWLRRVDELIRSVRAAPPVLATAGGPA